ncbi:sensor histidine kinase [Shewanella sp. Scap07]|uniref:sensor histidine kinase n=1 Tax=Shewanella sp. Scap07 TaxID=2589987 RepID=UPI0015C0ACF3|nr:ATP-binding protein [Shewanella sp. Scap07]QLE86015.1 sensor histidine kinase [Shewanella sp. Scap07]
MPLSKKNKQHIRVILVFALGLALTLKVAYWFHLDQGLLETKAQTQTQMKELQSFIDGALSRYESIPHVLSTNPLLSEALAHQDDNQALTDVNAYLEEVQNITEALDIYLINRSGVAVAASNWQTSYSFVGKDFGFRPYFSDAIAGNLGRYFAVGVTSNKRGFYFSYPIYPSAKPGAGAAAPDKQVIGVIVVKVDISDIETQSTRIARGSGYEFAISDLDNIIFLSSQREWRLQSFLPLDQQTQININNSKRYANRVITELKIDPSYHQSGVKYRLFSINQADHPDARYLEIKSIMNKASWRLHLLSPVKPVYQRLPAILLLYAALYVAAALALLFSLERRKNINQMQHAKQQLEQRVKRRTQALETSNAKLKDTQDELIQAAKLTVIGSLSASINHEINQPLAAIRSYAQNTKTMVERGRLDMVSTNVDTIITLTDRLAAIVAQFKSFTRKSHGQDSAIDLHQCIKDSLTIVQPEIDKQGVALQLSLSHDKLEIWGDSIRLQQVLVNLMSNAISAMNHSPSKRLHIATQSDQPLRVIISDSGTGIQENKIERIFDPYYTSSSHGLGLGLSISQRIIEAMNGKISVQNAPTHGAIFTITLPAYDMPATAANPPVADNGDSQ